MMKIKDIKQLNNLLEELLQSYENECVEFKEAKNDFDSKKLGKYFSAIANEANLRGKEYGWLIFGVEDKEHLIVGTQYRNSTKSLNSVKKKSQKTLLSKSLLLKFMNLKRKANECFYSKFLLHLKEFQWLIQDTITLVMVKN